MCARHCRAIRSARLGEVLVGAARSRELLAGGRHPCLADAAGPRVEPPFAAPAADLAPGPTSCCGPAACRTARRARLHQAKLRAHIRSIATTCDSYSLAIPRWALERAPVDSGN